MFRQPDEFLNERYSLRQILYETPRRTELFIVLTMYNVRFSRPSDRLPLFYGCALKFDCAS